MTCVAGSTFRLLDERVGWDPSASGGLGAISIDGGALTLARGVPAVPPERVAPPQLAWMCAGCTWWLGTERGILRLAPCDATFVPWMDAGPVRALAARGSWLAAIVDDGVVVFDVPGELLAGSARIAGATAVSLSPAGTLLVGDHAGILHELDLSGLACGHVDTGRPIARIGHLPSGPCRTIVVHDDASLSVVDRDGTVRRAGREALDGLARTAIAASTEHGFCLDKGGCFDWSGARVEPSALGPGEELYATQGQYLSEPLDSGVPSCRWHRVRVDADVPPGTTVAVAVATTDGPAEGRVAQLPAEGPWNAFAAGSPHPDDWFEAAPGVLDVTLRAPAGRYAYVRLRLTGTATATPVVHQVRLDLPRRTSLDELPAAFSEDDDARDFSERFLTLFDAQLEQVDEVIARLHALLDPESLPDDALGWLAGLLGLGFEAQMTVAQRRALLAAAPDLYRRRGTPSGLVDTLRIALGVEAMIQELGPARPWGALGTARLGAGLRLFGRSRARVRLGTSPLGSAPLLSRGNPDDDARLAGSNRIVVTVPPGSDRMLVERVVRSQTPAHVVATVRVLDPGLVLADRRLGLDTVLVAPAPAVVGAIRLGRAGVLRRGRASSSLAVVGKPLIVGSTTTTE